MHGGGFETRFGRIVGRGNGPHGLEGFIAYLGTPAGPGDFNRDGVVDAADYTVWRDGLGSSYTPADYQVWKLHFGTHVGDGSGGIVVVPEPTAAVLAVAGIATIGVFNRRKFRPLIAEAFSAQRGPG